jgi:hypothetical protein
MVLTGGGGAKSSTKTGTATTITSSSPPSIQESGTVSLVDSEGGHFSISNIEFGAPTSLSLSPSQSSNLQFGQDVEIRMTYVPNQGVLFDTLGKVMSISTDEAAIRVLNSNAPTTVPLSWEPKLGDEVILTISPETETPLIVITGVTSSSMYGVGVDSPSCLTETYAVFGGLIPGVCVFEASGQSLTIDFTYTTSIPIWENQPTVTSVTTSNSGFSVTSFSNFPGWDKGNVTLTMPRTDFIGNLYLSFTFS